MSSKRITYLSSVFLLFAACGDDTSITSASGPDDTGSTDGMTTTGMTMTVSITNETITATGDSTGESATGDTGETETSLDSSGEPVTCGDGIVEGDEECDDSNTDADDGCSDSCAIEDGWSCEGEPSTCAEACGDGVVTVSEACDDGNTDADDGCDDTCAVEDGWVCTDDAPSTCTPECGDGVLTGPEACDDGNTDADDGCSDVCEVENGFDCTEEPSVCVSTCGDGLVASDEVCDDMNLDPGDGCSDLCEAESGWDCMGEPSMCTTTCGDGLVAGAEACDDMNVMAGDGCDDMCAIEPGFGCTGEPSVCAPCDPADVSNIRFVELSIGTDYIDIQNTGACDASLNGLNVFFDDSSLTDLDTPLPDQLILAGETLRIFEPGSAGDIPSGGNIFFDASRGGAALLCTGVCTSDADVLDAVAFSEGADHPPLPMGVTFDPAGLTGIVDQFTEVYARIDFMGAPPTFFAADWQIQ